MDHTVNFARQSLRSMNSEVLSKKKEISENIDISLRRRQKRCALSFHFHIEWTRLTFLCGWPHTWTYRRLFNSFGWSYLTVKFHSSISKRFSAFFLCFLKLWFLIIISDWEVLATQNITRKSFCMPNCNY